MCTKIVKYRWDWRKPRFPQDINKNSLNARVTQQRSQNRLKWFLDFKSVLWNISTAKSAPTHQKPSWVFRYFEFSHHATSAGHNCPGCRQGLVSSHLWEVLSPKPAGWMLHGSSSRRRQTFAQRVWWGKTLDLMCLYAQSGQRTCSSGLLFPAWRRWQKALKRIKTRFWGFPHSVARWYKWPSGRALETQTTQKSRIFVFSLSSRVIWLDSDFIKS